MSTRKKDSRRCRWAVAYILVQLLCLSATFFIRNASDIGKADCLAIENGNITLSSEKVVSVVFSDKSVRVRDCYQYGRKERLAICSYIYQELSSRGFNERSVQSLEAELVLHSICYKLGIRREQAIDADLDVYGDERWYVAAGYSLLEVFGV